MEKTSKQGFISKCIGLIKKIPHFVTVDIWRFSGDEISKTRRFLWRTAMSVVVAFKGFTEDRLMVKASALTYYTLFAIVPMFALFFAIGRGFGMQKLIVDALAQQAGAHSGIMFNVLEFVNRYLEHAQGGVFVGIGVVMLIWSVMSGFNHVENIFNDIWHVKKSRNFANKISTYLSIMLILPIVLIATSGLSMFLVSAFSDELQSGVLSPVLAQFIHILPYVINILMFTALFAVVPNTHVKVSSALIAGIFTGVVFQLFQFLYIKGQVFLSSYNAVYGGFAMVPLLMLWLQISWFIILLGAELSFAVQNYSAYEYKADLQNMSRRYNNFLLLAVMSIIIKRFVSDQSAYTCEDISRENKIPIRIVRNTVNQLADVGLLVPVENDNTRSKVYYPAVDINKISISYIISKIDDNGTDTLNLENNEKLRPYWQKLSSMKSDLSAGDVLLKDI